MSTKFALHFQSNNLSSSQTQNFPEYVFSSPSLNYLSFLSLGSLTTPEHRNIKSYYHPKQVQYLMCFTVTVQGLSQNITWLLSELRHT